MLDRLKELKQRLEACKISKGCVHYYPDELREETLALHKESKLSANKFSEAIGISPKTIREWRIFFGAPKPDSKYPNYHRMTKGPKPKEESFITLSDAETQESVLAKKRLRNKQRYDKLKLESKVSKTQVIVSKPKEEVSEDVKVYLEKSINKAIPIVKTQGDIIPQKFRDMQDEWLSKNKPKRYVNGILIED